ncbi:hypothetical protein [Actinoplanes xinjiangensis]|uniref:hypothetical protein n=1 Tax=Actinoplanes xinjiangensis TaxID=512350 RepID=UPI0034345B7F
MNADDAARLRRLAAQPAWQHHGPTHPGGPACRQRWEMVVLAARKLVSEHRIAHARTLLEHRLCEVDLTGRTGDPWLIDAIVLLHHLPPTGTEDPAWTLASARFAYTCAVDRGDPERQLLTGDTLGHLAHEHGDYRLASTTLTAIWHQQQHAGHGDDSFTVRLRLRLADSLHHGGRCGQALWHTSRTWQDWTRTRIRSPRQGARIAVAHAHLLTGCRLHREAADLLDQARRIAPSLQPILEPITAAGSPTAARLAAAHQPVCARRLTVDGTPDPTAVYAAEQAWTATGRPR